MLKIANKKYDLLILQKNPERVDLGFQESKVACHY